MTAGSAAYGHVCPTVSELNSDQKLIHHAEGRELQVLHGPYLSTPRHEPLQRPIQSREVRRVQPSSAPPRTTAAAPIVAVRSGIEAPATLESRRSLSDTPDRPCRCMRVSHRVVCPDVDCGVPGESRARALVRASTELGCFCVSARSR
jgi:hypothetical protein